jgi:integrase
MEANPFPFTIGPHRIAMRGNAAGTWRRVNPHLFRDCAVRTIADRGGDEMGIASALLQHADSRVTDEHYNKGKMVTAVRRYQTIVENLEVE